MLIKQQLLWPDKWCPSGSARFLVWTEPLLCLFCKRNSKQLRWTPHRWFYSGLPAQLCSVWVYEAPAVTSGWLAFSFELMTTTKFPAQLHPSCADESMVGRSEIIWVALPNHWIVSPLAPLCRWEPLSLERVRNSWKAWLSPFTRLVAECGSLFFASPETLASVGVLWFREMSISHSSGLYTVLWLPIWERAWTQLSHWESRSLSVQGSMSHNIHVVPVSMIAHVYIVDEFLSSTGQKAPHNPSIPSNSSSFCCWIYILLSIREEATLRGNYVFKLGSVRYLNRIRLNPHHVYVFTSNQVLQILLKHSSLSLPHVQLNTSWSSVCPRWSVSLWGVWLWWRKTDVGFTDLCDISGLNL